MLNPPRIRVNNALTSTTSAPTAATDGIAIPKQKRYKSGFRCQRIALEVVTNGGTTPTLTSYIQLRDDGTIDLVLIKGAASGTRTLQVRVHIYDDKYQTLTENAGAGMDTLTDVASSAKWSEAYDTGALSSSGDFNKRYRLGPF